MHWSIQTHGRTALTSSALAQNPDPTACRPHQSPHALINPDARPNSPHLFSSGSKPRSNSLSASSITTCANRSRRTEPRCYEQGNVFIGLAITVYIHRTWLYIWWLPCHHTVYVGLARTVYIHRIFGDFQAKNTVCTPYIYGSGQPYVFTIESRQGDVFAIGSEQ